MSLKNKIDDSLVIIPARAGSKGVLKKNIKKLNSKELVRYTIEFALKNFKKENIFISTDCDEVYGIAKDMQINIPFMRPKHLATDESSIHETLKHVINFKVENGLNFPKTVLLQPTSPFRRDEDIHKMNKEFNNKYDAIVSVSESKSNPYFNLFETDEKGFLIKSKSGNYYRRQDCPKVYEFNGSIYIFNTAKLLKGYLSDFKKIKKYEMSSIYSIDIDTDFDWIIAELIAKSKFEI